MQFIEVLVPFNFHNEIMRRIYCNICGTGN